MLDEARPADDASAKPPLADRGWWLAVEYGVVTKQSRFEKKLEKLRGLGSMKELLEPGGRIVYRNLFREDQTREAWTLLAELTPWKSQLQWWLNGEEIDFKDAQEILWCAGFLKSERPCRGVAPEARDADTGGRGAAPRASKGAHAWAIGCDRKVSVAPTGFAAADGAEARPSDEASAEKRHVLGFAKVDERGVLRFDREAIAAFLASGTLNRRCPLSPARDPAKVAEIFQDVSVRALGWPVVLEMTPELKKKLGASVLEAEHGFVLKKGAKDLEEYEPVELRFHGGEVEVRRARDLRGASIARQVRMPKKVQTVLEGGARLRGVRIEEGYVKLAELGGRYEVEQRFVLATRFHLGIQDDPSKYEGYEVVTVPKATPEYEKWARAVLEAVP